MINSGCEEWQCNTAFGKLAKPVYVFIRLVNECAACACNRQIAIPQDFNTSEFGDAVINAVQREERWQLSPMMKDAHQISAMVPAFPVWLAIFLPTYAQLPNNGHFHRGAYGTFSAYEGPFVANYFSGTGYIGGLLEPRSVFTQENLLEIECIRNENKFTKM